MALIVGLLLQQCYCSINLGGLPLRDWDEGTVAQVARDIYVVHLVLGAGFTRP